MSEYLQGYLIGIAVGLLLARVFLGWRPRR
jgi:hypothetical protein